MARHKASTYARGANRADGKVTVDVTARDHPDIRHGMLSPIVTDQPWRAKRRA
jgi:hypothetical protein